jgi:hypothetical protein
MFNLCYFQANYFANAGDYAGARRMSDNAKKLMITSVFIGIILLVIFVSLKLILYNDDVYNHYWQITKPCTFYDNSFCLYKYFTKLNQTFQIKIKLCFYLIKQLNIIWCKYIFLLNYIYSNVRFHQQTAGWDLKRTIDDCKLMYKVR